LKDILDDTLSEYEQAKLGVHEYIVGVKNRRIWENILENNPPTSRQMALDRVRGFDVLNPDEFALIGTVPTWLNTRIYTVHHECFYKFLFENLVDEATRVEWQTVINCDFVQVGEEFSRKPYAIAVQKGSPLKESFSRM